MLQVENNPDVKLYLVIDYANDGNDGHKMRNLGPVTTTEDSAPSSVGDLFEIVNLFSKGDGSKLINSHRVIQSGYKGKFFNWI
jgi:hypothetical protein